jgi:RHS repeat-associated protein
MTDQAAAVVWAADYLPFGEVDVTVGTVENNLRFAGQYYDGETGLHYNYHRYYDPKLGRYLRADPIGLFGGMNSYLYSLANPINRIDYFGLNSIKGEFFMNVRLTDFTYDFDFDPEFGHGPGSARIGYWNFYLTGNIDAGIKCKETCDDGKEIRSWELSLDVNNVTVNIGRMAETISLTKYLKNIRRLIKIVKAGKATAEIIAKYKAVYAILGEAENAPTAFCNNFQGDQHLDVTIPSIPGIY